MHTRIEILAHKDDGRAKTIEKILERLNVTAQVRAVDVYTSESAAAKDEKFANSLANPVTQKINLRCHPCESRDLKDTKRKDSSLRWNDREVNFDWALEIGFLPGVTDNVGHTTSELLSLVSNDNDNTCYSSRLYLIKAKTDKETIQKLATEISNDLIQRISIKSKSAFDKDGGMDVVIPKVNLDNKGAVADNVDLNVSDEKLEEIGNKGIANADGSRRGPLGLSLHYMKAIQEYFKQQGRPATDIELETLAQTWSEHCKHTIFASPIDDVKDGLYRHYIKRATREIREMRKQEALKIRHPERSEGSHSTKDLSTTDATASSAQDDIYWKDDDRFGDFCVSVFSDNAGGIIFDDDYLITDKVETHNSPSALDPFGGAITGIVGVNRDCMGFGLGAKPIINRYGFCLAPVPVCPPERNTTEQDPSVVTLPQDDRFNYFRDKDLTKPILSSKTIMNGVIAGVEAGGNCSGIPTPQGFVTFDDRFAGKPLVFVGTIGLIPREINSKPSHIKKANPGDKIVMAGGRVGADGIHGATFSSVALDEGSPATAVQIGDPITQKKMSDAIIKEIREKGWYSAITDNGAGGLSSSVGEMAEQSGGFHLELEKVPLKYPGLSPWEIWISESQERMTLAVPPENTDKLIEFLAKRGVEATVIGTYTDTHKAHITWHDETILDLDMDFLHDGNPETPLKTTFTRGGEKEPDITEPIPYCHPERSEGSKATEKDSSARSNAEHCSQIKERTTPSALLRPQNDTYENVLLKMLSRLNICSREFISTQYDHNVQGSAVLGPLQGKGRVFAETSISRPLFNSPKGVVLSQGLFPRYSDIDTAAMAAAGMDMAVRNAVAAGCPIDHLALLDNFCWCSSDEPERLGQLKRAVEAIYDIAVKYGTPFISGKDSMFNDFKGYDAKGEPIKISAPPTLLASSIGVIPNIDRAISLAPKAPGDLVYLLGATKDELGASEYYDMHGVLGNNVPETDAHENLRLYRLYSRASRDKLIASALALGYGGLGAALAKKAIAGGLGLDIDLSSICHPDQGERRAEGSLDYARDDGLRTDKALFSESTGRIVVTVAPKNKKNFERNFKGFEHCTYIGSVAHSENLFIRDVLKINIKDLEEAYKAPLREY